jgi:hypothetical protein
MNWLHSYVEKFRGGKRVPPKAPYYKVLWLAIGAFLGILSVYEIGHFEQLPDSQILFRNTEWKLCFPY